MTNSTKNYTLKRPCMETRERAIEHSIGTMPEVDREYMYEKQKQNQHQEKVVTAFLKLIRKYDFLPKRCLLEGFQEAVKHIYAANEEEARKEEYLEGVVERVSNIKEEDL